MPIDHAMKKSLYDLFHVVRLRSSYAHPKPDQQAKIEQILSYLEVIDAQVRKISKKRKIILVDCGAGNCYLSFLVYFYYSRIRPLGAEIHCIDTNTNLMDNAAALAGSLGFDGMHFHPCDILDFQQNGPVDGVYSLHACDTATDKALYLGITLKAKAIFSVSCCQHSMSRQFKSRALKGVTKYKSFKSRILYMVADSLRAQLLEMKGYKVDIFDFISSRYTDKNIMIRARKQGGPPSSRGASEEFRSLSTGFNIRPKLEEYLKRDAAVL